MEQLTSGRIEDGTEEQICKIKTTGLYKTGWEKHFCR